LQAWQIALPCWPFGSVGESLLQGKFVTVLKLTVMQSIVSTAEEHARLTVQRLE